VFTSHQLTELAFGHLDTAEERLRTLTALGVLDRFRPRRDTGSAPYHYVLGPAGAAVLAAEQGVTVADLGYRRATALAVAHSRRLPEILRVNGFFTALAGYARHHPNTELTLWWSQQRCQATWGRLIQPHGFGHWREHELVLGFFLECHSDQQPISYLIAALAGYDDLALATPQRATNLLVWITTTRREGEIHRAVPHAATSSPPPPPRWQRPRRRRLAPPRHRWAAATPGRPGRPPPLGIRAAMNRTDSAAPAECWSSDGPSRRQGARHQQQPTVTVLLPEDLPLLAGPAAAVLLRILVDAAESPAERRDGGALRSRPNRGRTR